MCFFHSIFSKIDTNHQIITNHCKHYTIINNTYSECQFLTFRFIWLLYVGPFFFSSLFSPFGVIASTSFSLLLIPPEIKDEPLFIARGVIVVVSFFDVICDSFAFWLIASTLFSLCSEMFFESTGVRFLCLSFSSLFFSCSNKNDRFPSFSFSLFYFPYFSLTFNRLCFISDAFLIKSISSIFVLIPDFDE